MSKIVKFIPNAITLLNILSGVFSIYFSSNGHLEWAAYAIFFAAVFDFFDGFVARLLNATSEIGKELDSLSDVVSFGVAPGFIAFQMLEANMPQSFLSFIAFLIPLMAAYRLARFNVLHATSSSFTGLPVPAVGIFFSSVVFLQAKEGLFFDFPNHLVIGFLLFNIILLSSLMVSNVKLFSLKLKSYNLKNAFWQYLLILLSIVLFLFFELASLWMVIYLYLLINIFKKAD